VDHDGGGVGGGDGDGDGGRSGSRKANSIGKRMLEGDGGIALRGTWPWLYDRSSVPTTLVCRAINRNSFIPGDLYWIRLRARGGAGAGAVGGLV